jgi:ankyrin repeat protein
LAAGANLNARAENSIGNTPLMSAIAGGHLQLAELLLRRGADPTLSDKNGLSAAQLALANGHMEFAEKLLKLRPWG